MGSRWMVIAVFFCYSSASFLGAETFQEPSTKQKFPVKVGVNIDGKSVDLVATGAALRKKFVTKVYVVAHYTEASQEGGKGIFFDDVMKPGKTKQLTLRWMRDVMLEQIRDAFYESFDISLDEDQKDLLAGNIRSFLALYDEDALKGTEHVIRWLPGGVVELWIHGKKKGEVVSDVFGEGLWSIWFGPKSVVDRNELVSRMTR